MQKCSYDFDVTKNLFRSHSFTDAFIVCSMFQDSPKCTKSKLIMAASEGTNVTIPCRVDALPPQVQFQWSINSTEGLRLLSRNAVSISIILIRFSVFERLGLL